VTRVHFRYCDRHGSASTDHRCSDEIFEGETRYDDHVTGPNGWSRWSDDDRGVLVRFDYDFLGRTETRLAERRHRRPLAGGRLNVHGRVPVHGRLAGGALAVLLDDRGRGHHGRGRGGRHEVATATTAAAAAATVAAGGLPAVVSDRRVRVERHGSVVALAEAPVRVMGGEYATERVPELRVEYRVDDRIERRVGVAEPREHFERGLGYTRLAERRDDVHAKERHPAQQERAHYDAHRYGGLVVAHVVRRRVMVMVVIVVVMVVDGRQCGARRGRRRGRRGRRRRRHRRGARGRRRGVDGGGQRPRHRADALHVLLRVAVQPAVDADHHHARYVEADARRYDRVRGRQVQRARHVLGVARVEHYRLGRPVDAQYADGHHGHERGQSPDAGDAQQRVPSVQVGRVPGRAK